MTTEQGPQVEAGGGLDFHIVRVEVTVAAAITLPDGHILGDNMVDGTLAFGWRMSTPPEGISDAEVNAALTKQMSPVLALIQTALTFNGWVAMGQVDEPMTENSSATGEVGRSSPEGLSADQRVEWTAYQREHPGTSFSEWAAWRLSR